MVSRNGPGRSADDPLEMPTLHGDLFVGRRLDVDGLVAALLEPGHVTVSICGVSGVGKTALAEKSRDALVRMVTSFLGSTYAPT